MRAPVSWLRELVSIPADQDGRRIADALVRAGLEVETVETVGDGIEGELRIGRVESVEELSGFKKPIRWCQVHDGRAVRGIICGARNFSIGDLVVVALPGTTLPGGFTIGKRETYGHVSDGMLCSERELGLGDAHDGIITLEEGIASPGDDATSVLGIGDQILDIAVTPDRGYALSMRGLARELAIAYGVPFVDPGQVEADLPAPSAVRALVECSSDDMSACQLFTIRTIAGFDPSAPSPAWLQRRLQSCGMRPISLAVDVTNYVMLELGQPLHAFDANKLQGGIHVRRARHGERLTTLDHVERTLDIEDLVLADDRGVIGLAGTMGGLETEIDEHTRDIALEAAYFDDVVVARMARRHKLSSEASRRFERGVDRELAPYASARAAQLLLEFGGGIHVGLTGVEAPITTSAIGIDVLEPARIGGLDIAPEQAIALWQAVGCSVDGSEGLVQVLPPSWRPDLTDGVDLVEEVLRLVGYDQLPSTLPQSPAGHGLSAAQRARRLAGTILSARGAVEVLNYPFVADQELDDLRIHPDSIRRSRVKLANPMSEQQPWLRADLMPGLIAAARRNLSRGAQDMHVFEIGIVFQGSAAPISDRPSVEHRPDAATWTVLNESLPAQPLMAGGLMVGDLQLPGWWGEAKRYTWIDAVAAVESVAEGLGVTLTRTSASEDGFHPGRCAQFMHGALVIGVAGELHPGVLSAVSLPERACAWQINLSALIELAQQVRPAPALSTQPVAKEDVALLVPVAVPAADVASALARGAGPLLESVRLFDVYQGPQVPEGLRSLAFALRFRALDRTLEASETALARQSAVDRAIKECGAQLRA